MQMAVNHIWTYVINSQTVEWVIVFLFYFIQFSVICCVSLLLLALDHMRFHTTSSFLFVSLDIQEPDELLTKKKKNKQMV